MKVALDVVLKALRQSAYFMRQIPVDGKYGGDAAGFATQNDRAAALLSGYICKGCGRLQNEMLRHNALACCPESSITPPRERMTVGVYNISYFDADSFWISGASGEGMQVKNDVLERLIGDFYKENF